MNQILFALKGTALFVGVMMLLTFSPVHPGGIKFELEIYQQYLELQEMEVLSKDITFAYWLELQQEALVMEKEMENTLEVDESISE